MFTSILHLESSTPKLEGIEGLGGPEIFETFAIDNLWNDDWRKEIIEFLKKPNRNKKSKDQI